MLTDCTLTADEIRIIEAERFDTLAEAELNANDLANDGCDGDVYRVGDKWAVKVILN